MQTNPEKNRGARWKRSREDYYSTVIIGKQTPRCKVLAVILSFALVAFISWTVSLALGELASMHPAAGSFEVNGDLYLDDWAGVISSAVLASHRMRPVALGRKNWIHIGSPQAGPKVAAILSVVESCRRLNLPVRNYLAAVLPGLADRPIRLVAGFTPAAWVARHS
jgi:hypothetical protein